MVVGAGHAASAAVGDTGSQTYFTPVGWAAVAIRVRTVTRTHGTGTAGAKPRCIVWVTHITAGAAVGFVGLGVDFAAVVYA